MHSRNRLSGRNADPRQCRVGCRLVITFPDGETFRAHVARIRDPVLTVQAARYSDALFRFRFLRPQGQWITDIGGVLVEIVHE